MDYPFSEPGVDLTPAGRFTDGDPAAGIPPSRDPASWANAVTEEILAVVRAAGITPDEHIHTQLLEAIRELIISGSDGDVEVAPGLYTKVKVDDRGRVIWGGQLTQGDLPAISFSQIENKPTTVEGYGITDAAPINSPEFTGTPKAPAPPAFSDSKQIATTHFVREALGNYSKVVTHFLSVTHLSTSSLGAFVNARNTSPSIITLPNLSDIYWDGAIITILVAKEAGPVTIQFFEGDLVGANGQQLHDWTLRPSQLAHFWPDLARNRWVLYGGDAALGYTASFASGWGDGLPITGLLGEWGYQTLPSGLIMQWVTGKTDIEGYIHAALPIEFPNSPLWGLATDAEPALTFGDTRASVWAYDPIGSNATHVTASGRCIDSTGVRLVANMKGRIVVWGH
ncbi:hypothetical protein D3C78_342570 [compost metagenome]